MINSFRFALYFTCHLVLICCCPIYLIHFIRCLVLSICSQRTSLGNIRRILSLETNSLSLLLCKVDRSGQNKIQADRYLSTINKPWFFINSKKWKLEYWLQHHQFEWCKEQKYHFLKSPPKLKFSGLSQNFKNCVSVYFGDFTFL